MAKRMLCMLICFLLLPLSAFAVSVRIVQIWDDGNDINHLRPASVPVTVSSDEESLLVADDQIHELSGSNISFLQAELPASYTSTSIIKEKNNLLTAVFINRHPVEMTPVFIQNKLHVIDSTARLTITKIAEQARAEDQFCFLVELPKTYDYVTSRGSSGKTDEPVVLHAGEYAMIEGIPVGTAYKVEEIPDPRYVSTSTDAEGFIGADGSEVTFTNHLIETTFTVFKQWEGTDKGPIRLQLYADGEKVNVQPEKTGNTYTFCQLPKYASDGHEILYSAKEEYIDGYMTMYVNKGEYANRSKAVYAGGTIINREYVNFYIHKEWIGVPEDQRPEVRFQLYQNGIQIEWRQPEKLSNGIYIWHNLPKMKNGEEAVYSAKEIAIPGYENKYSNPHSGVKDAALNGGTVINYKVPKTGDMVNVPLLWLFVIFSSAGLLTACIFLLRNIKRHGRGGTQ